MSVTAHSTSLLPSAARAGHWNAVIAKTYFPLHLTYRDAATFDGRLEHQSLGDLSLSRLQTEPVQYERHPRHIAGASEEQYLITIPRRSPVEFRQLGREVRCDPGGFIIERGDEPYRFSYEAANDLCVLKVAKPVLSTRLRNPDRFCALVFNGRDGLGGLFTTMAQHVQAQATSDLAAGAVLGRQLIELLTLTLDRTIDSADVALSSVRAAHLKRAEDVIRRNLSNPDLSPDLVADACGISKRLRPATCCRCPILARCQISPIASAFPIKRSSRGCSRRCSVRRPAATGPARPVARPGRATRPIAATVRYVRGSDAPRRVSQAHWRAAAHAPKSIRD